MNEEKPKQETPEELKARLEKEKQDGLVNVGNFGSSAKDGLTIKKWEDMTPSEREKQLEEDRKNLGVGSTRKPVE